jgi:hypothetical protein
MTVSEDDIIYSYGKIRETIRAWTVEDHTPTMSELRQIINSYPDKVGDEEKD